MSQLLDNQSGDLFGDNAFVGVNRDVRHVHYEQIAQAIGYLVEHQQTQPSLTELAAAIGLSEFHLQRLFTEWAGVSPKQFLQFLTKEFAKRELKNSTVLNASLNSGLSSPARLHDLLLKWESVTPGEIRQAGKGMEIRYGLHSTPFGYCLLAVSERGICKLAFLDDETQLYSLIEELRDDWVHAHIIEDATAGQSLCQQMFAPAKQSGQPQSVRMLLQGSPFRVQVWEALLRVPERSICSYQSLADSMDRPTATRAVASAIAANRIAYLIPCHRVIRSTGVLSHYRWGKTRKAAMIAYEQGRLPD